MLSFGMEMVGLYIVSLKLLLSLIIGILFGIERDLKGIQSGEADADEAHFGGTRTFALIGLLGGLCAYAGILIAHPIYVYGFIAVAFFVAVSIAFVTAANSAAMVTGLVIIFSARGK